MYYVYLLIDPRTEEPRYIGQSSDPETRLQAHIGLKDYKKNWRLVAWILELKEENLAPKLELVGGYRHKELALRAEKLWIQRGMKLGWQLCNIDQAQMYRDYREEQIRKFREELKRKGLPEDWVS